MYFCSIAWLLLKITTCISFFLCLLVQSNRVKQRFAPTKCTLQLQKKWILQSLHGAANQVHLGHHHQHWHLQQLCCPGTFIVQTGGRTQQYTSCGKEQHTYFCITHFYWNPLAIVCVVLSIYCCCYCPLIFLTPLAEHGAALQSDFHKPGFRASSLVQLFSWRVECKRQLVFHVGPYHWSLDLVSNYPMSRNRNWNMRKALGIGNREHLWVEGTNMIMLRFCKDCRCCKDAAGTRIWMQ